MTKCGLRARLRTLTASCSERSLVRLAHWGGSVYAVLLDVQAYVALMAAVMRTFLSAVASEMFAGSSTAHIKQLCQRGFEEKCPNTNQELFLFASHFASRS